MARIKKMQAGGVSGKQPKAGLVDPSGAWTKVQERTLGNMKRGGKVGRSEKQMGLHKKQKASKEINPASFRKAQMSRESELISKRSGEQAPMAKDGKWIQKAVKGMRKDKPCTGSKFGSKTCPPGSKRYNLAKTFKAMGKTKKK